MFREAEGTGVEPATGYPARHFQAAGNPLSDFGKPLIVGFNGDF
jgi:hypothetical protein